MGQYLSGINESTSKILFKDKISDSYDDLMSTFEKELISTVTLEKNFKSILYLAILCTKKKLPMNIIKYNKNTGNISINYEGCEYSIIKLSDLLSNIKEELSVQIIERLKNNINCEEMISTFRLFPSNEKIKELLTYDRAGKCHEQSMKLCMIMPGSVIITGYVNSLESRYLHSILLIPQGDQYLACDWTLNLVISYVEYQRIQNFEPICKITYSEFIDDLNYGVLYHDFVSTKEYCVFRHELARDFEKNKNLLKK